MVSFAGIAVILVLIGAFGCLFSHRARPFALGILGLAALGFLFARVSERPTPPPVDWAYAPDAQQLEVQHQATFHQAEQAEILVNQRMAARMDDAFVQNSPDGSTLETYPDGMQVRQRGSDGFRSIVRSARGDGERWGSSPSTRSEIKLWLLGAPLLALIVAFIALKHGKRAGGVRFGAGLAVAGVAAMVLLGFVFSWSSRHVTIGTPVPPPRIAELEFDPFTTSPDSHAEIVRVHQEMLGNLHDVVQQEPIEALWTKLTAPQINLNAPADPAAKATQRELANAAKVILSASAPGADPFTQGWLMNAAKAIMSAAPKGNLNAHETAVAEIAAPPTATTVVQTPDKPRPEWIDNTPKTGGDTRRVVVSTDPLKTTEECHVQLEKRLRYAVADRIRELAKQATGRSVVNSPMLADMGISPDFILRELCPEGAYVETVNGSTGEMKRAHALIEFTPQKDKVLLQRWQSATRTPGSGSAYAGSAAAEAAPMARSYTTGERPEWLDQPPKLVGNTRRVVVSTDPFVTVEECHAALRDKLRGVVQARVDELARAANGGHYTSTPGLDSMGINIEYILSELCPEDDYIETINTSVGEMKRAYALVEFNEAQDRILLDRWRAYARVQSIEIVAGLSAFVVAVLAFVYGLLKVDTWTRGYYTKRLFLGVPAAIIAVFFITALFGF